MFYCIEVDRFIHYSTVVIRLAAGPLGPVSTSPKLSVRHRAFQPPLGNVLSSFDGGRRNGRNPQTFARRCQMWHQSNVLSFLPSVLSDIFSLKQESSIFRSVIQPCMWFWICQARSPCAKQHRAKPVPSWINHI